MPTQAQWSAGAVVLALVPILRLLFSLTVQGLPGYKLQDFVTQIRRDTQFTDVHLTTENASNLGELFGRRPAILRALNSYAEYGSTVQFFLEASVLGILSILVSLAGSLRHTNAPAIVWPLFILKLLLLLAFLVLFTHGYYRHVKGQNDPANINIPKKYRYLAVAFNAISAMLEISWTAI